MKNISEMERIFLFISLFNTALGLSNKEENNKQIERQKRIEEKLDRVLEILEKEKNI